MNHNQLDIIREINGATVNITLTDTELEQAYRVKEHHYLEEDLIKTLTDAFRDNRCRFHYEHLVEFPEILDWLCERFSDFYDSNMSHNDLLELVVRHLDNVSLTSDFFMDLAARVSSVCLGEYKDLDVCEENCQRYYRCGNIAIADDRMKTFEDLSCMMHEHRQDTCSCNKTDKSTEKCPAARYISNEWGIETFFTFGNPCMEVA